LILAAVVIGFVFSITPVQILWVNMVTVVTLALALAFEPAEPGVMKMRPRDPFTDTEGTISCVDELLQIDGKNPPHPEAVFWMKD
jgi:magnesium-transporting ATPase (P-type)